MKAKAASVLRAKISQKGHSRAAFARALSPKGCVGAFGLAQLRRPKPFNSAKAAAWPFWHARFACSADRAIMAMKLDIIGFTIGQGLHSNLVYQKDFPSSQKLGSNATNMKATFAACITRVPSLVWSAVSVLSSIEGLSGETRLRLDCFVWPSLAFSKPIYLVWQNNYKTAAFSRAFSSGNN